MTKCKTCGQEITRDNIFNVGGQFIFEVNRDSISIKDTLTNRVFYIEASVKAFLRAVEYYKKLQRKRK